MYHVPPTGATCAFRLVNHTRPHSSAPSCFRAMFTLTLLWLQTHTRPLVRPLVRLTKPARIGNARSLPLTHAHLSNSRDRRYGDLGNILQSCDDKGFTAPLETILSFCTQVCKACLVIVNALAWCKVLSQPSVINRIGAAVPTTLALTCAAVSQRDTPCLCCTCHVSCVTKFAFLCFKTRTC